MERHCKNGRCSVSVSNKNGNEIAAMFSMVIWYRNIFWHVYIDSNVPAFQNVLLPCTWHVPGLIVACTASRLYLRNGNWPRATTITWTYACANCGNSDMILTGNKGHSNGTNTIVFVSCYRLARYHATTVIARFMGPTWGPPGTGRTQVGPMLSPWTLLSGIHSNMLQLLVDLFSPFMILSSHNPIT